MVEGAVNGDTPMRALDYSLSALLHTNQGPDDLIMRALKNHFKPQYRYNQDIKNRRRKYKVADRFQENVSLKRTPAKSIKMAAPGI